MADYSDVVRDLREIQAEYMANTDDFYRGIGTGIFFAIELLTRAE